MEGNAAKIWSSMWNPRPCPIVTGAPRAGLQAWADAVGDAVSSLRWTSP